MKTRNMKLAAVIQGLILVLTLGLSVAFAGQPTEDVKAIIDEVMSILRNPAYQSPGQKATRLRLIEESALRRLDYEEMSRRCLEETWNTISAAQRGEFMRMFTQLLKASYADKLDDFAKSKVAYEGESQKGDHAEVRILVLRPNDKIPVKFQLLNSPKGWMIYDLVVEDVSLMNNLRTEFGRIIKASSFAALMKCLRLKIQSNIAELKSCPVPEAPPRKGRLKGGS
jgi:phospholipid transport system substrate-binding protein